MDPAVARPAPNDQLTDSTRLGAGPTVIWAADLRKTIGGPAADQLQSFAHFGDCASALALLEKHPKLNVDAASFDGFTALHKAAASGHCDMVSLLLARGADANACGSHDGRTPLMNTGQPGVAMLLLGAGAAPLTAMTGATAMRTGPASSATRGRLRNRNRSRTTVAQRSPEVQACVRGFGHMPLLYALRRLLLASAANAAGVPEDLTLDVLEAMAERARRAQPRVQAQGDAALLLRAQQQGCALFGAGLAHAAPAFGLDASLAARVLEARKRQATNATRRFGNSRLRLAPRGGAAGRSLRSLATGS